MTVTRISLVTEIPSPYRIPLFNSLAAQPDIELDVVFLRDRQEERPHPLYADEFRFRWSVLRSAVVTGGYRWLLVTAGAGRAVRRLRPDVLIVGGWNQPAFWSSHLAARRRRVPVVAWVESTLSDSRQSSRLRNAAKRAFIRSCAACIVPGSAAAEYVRALGVPTERIQIAPNAVDLDIFGARVAELHGERSRLRDSLGLDKTVALYVGRLSPEKGVDVLIRSLALVGSDVELIVIGTGPEEDELRRLATDVAPGRVRFAGFLSRDDLVTWYAVADLLVVPSRSEVWGMTLNEGAAAGLPLVATEAAGGAWDLIEEGANGFRVPSEDARGLARAIDRLADDPAFRARAGRRSTAISAAWTPDAWAEAVASLARRIGRRQ